MTTFIVVILFIFSVDYCLLSQFIFVYMLFKKKKKSKKKKKR